MKCKIIEKKYFLDEIKEMGEEFFRIRNILGKNNKKKVDDLNREYMKKIENLIKKYGYMKKCIKGLDKFGVKEFGVYSSSESSMIWSYYVNPLSDPYSDFEDYH